MRKFAILMLVSGCAFPGPPMMVQDRQWLAQQDSTEWWVHVTHQDEHELRAVFIIEDAEVHEHQAISGAMYGQTRGDAIELSTGPLASRHGTVTCHVVGDLRDDGREIVARASCDRGEIQEINRREGRRNTGQWVSFRSPVVYRRMIFRLVSGG